MRTTPIKKEQLAVQTRVSNSSNTVMRRCSTTRKGFEAQSFYTGRGKPFQPWRMKMPKIKLKGNVFYKPGAWGLSVPVKGAHITIYDRDVPGRGDDNILQTTTGNNGKFSGESSEWRDRVTIVAGSTPPFGPPIPAVTANDPTDVAALSVVVKQSAAQTFITPALLLPTDSTEATFPPIIVPWEPGGAPAKVDGQDCWTPTDLMDRIAGKLKRGENFTIDAYGHEFDGIKAITQSEAAMEQYLGVRAPGIGAAIARFKESFENANGSANYAVAETGAIVAVAVLVIAMFGGMAIFTIAVGISTALVLALILNYEVSFETTQEVSADGTVRQRTRIIFVKRALLQVPNQPIP
jgi:hypothetical protein